MIDPDDLQRITAQVLDTIIEQTPRLTRPASERVRLAIVSDADLVHLIDKANVELFRLEEAGHEVTHHRFAHTGERHHVVFLYIPGGLKEIAS